ncbi:MAG: ParA family protein [Pseudomonadota bacterium]
MPNVVAIMNAKGGVGKTTVSMMLADGLAYYKKARVLLIDADPQSSLSYARLGEFGMEKIDPVKIDEEIDLDKPTLHGKTLPDLLVSLSRDTLKAIPKEFIHEESGNISNGSSADLLPNSPRLAITERRFQSDETIFSSMKTLISIVSQKYDWVIIDCSPSITRFSEAWLEVADLQIIPVKPDYMSRTSLIVLTALRGAASIRGRKLATPLGMIATMVRNIPSHNTFIDNLRRNNKRDLFFEVIKERDGIAKSAQWSDEPQPFVGKYSGDGNQYIVGITNEFLHRVKNI